MPPKKAAKPVKPKAASKPKAAPKKKVGTATSLTIHPDPPACKKGALLSGSLGILPLEILVDTVVLLAPAEFYNFQASCHALTDLVSQNETSVYSRLYNAVESRTGTNHALYSPVWKKAVKGATVPVYPLSEKLGVDAVYDWKVQYKQDAMWNMGIQAAVSKRCMSCAKLIHHSLLEVIDEWRMRVCKLCFLTSLVTVSNVSIYALTAGDLGTLKTLPLMTQGLGGNKLGNFYSAFDLKALHVQKHGKFETQLLPATLKAEAKEERRDLVTVASWLQSGNHYDTDFSDRRVKLEDEDIDQGYFHSEFDHYISNDPFKKPKKGAPLPANNHPKGFTRSFELKKRPIQEILEDFKTLIQDHADAFPDVSGRPVFLPALEDSPAVPTDESIEAYGKIKEVMKRFSIPNFSSNDFRYATTTYYRLREIMRPSQNYLLHPTEENLEPIIAFSENYYFMNRSRSVAPLNLTLPDITAVDNFQALCVAKLGASVARSRKNNLIRINQISLILGGRGYKERGGGRSFKVSSQPLDERDVKEILAEVDWRTLQGHWAIPHYTTGENIRLLSSIYQSTIVARDASLKKVAARVEKGEDGEKLYPGLTTAFSQHLTQFGEKYTQGMNCQATRLSNRTLVTYNEIAEEHAAIVGLSTTGVVSQSALFAVLMKSGDCKCENGFSGFPCTSGCFVTEIVIGEIVAHEERNATDDESDLYEFDWM